MVLPTMFNVMRRSHSYQGTSKTLFGVSRQNLNEEAKTLLNGEYKQAFDAVIAAVQKMVELNDAGAAAASKRGDEFYANARLTIISVLIGALVVGLLLALFISRIISRPLNIAAQVAGQLAEGNLTAKIEVTPKDTIVRPGCGSSPTRV